MTSLPELPTSKLLNKAADDVCSPSISKVRLSYFSTFRHDWQNPPHMSLVTRPKAFAQPPVNSRTSPLWCKSLNTATPARILFLGKLD